MKHDSIFMQALCLATLLIMACGGRLPVKKHCYPARIMKENENLKNKTEAFIKLFPDKNMSVKLLTEALKSDFMQNCSTRDNLISFYAQEVLSVGKISAEAKKRGIEHDFLKIQDMLQSCPSSKCESTEVTQNMKELREKFDGNKAGKAIKKLNKANKAKKARKARKKLNKAVSELNNLLLWIHEFSYEMKNRI